MKKISIYTDGSCLGNPGPGGWGVVVLDGELEDMLSGNEAETTNNRMEMMAIIEALKWVHEKYSENINELEINIFSDSNLIIQTLNKGWKKKANTDLWAEIEKLTAWLNITWTWVKAHALNKYNNQADQLAFNAAQDIKKAIS